MDWSTRTNVIFFSKIANVTLTLTLEINLKCKLVGGIVILNIAVMLCQNEIINEVARGMAKHEPTYSLAQRIENFLQSKN